MAARTSLWQPSGFSLLDRMIDGAGPAVGWMPCANSDASRPREVIHSPVAPTPSVWTNERRESDMVETSFTLDIASPPFLAGRGRGRAEHALEHADGLLHLGHRADGDAGVGLLVRREIASHEHSGPAAGIPESGGGSPDVHEDEVGLRVGAGDPHVGERLHGERLHLGVALPLLLDVR